MNFGEFDVKILFVSALSLLLISAVAGATPLAGDFGELPTYESNAELNFDVPNQPGPEVSTEGTLVTGPDIEGYEREEKFIVTDRVEASLIATGYQPDNNNTDVNVVLEFTNGTNTTLDNEVLNLSESTLLETSGIGVRVSYAKQTNDTASIDWNVEYRPEFSETDGDNSGIWGALMNIGEWIGYIAQLIAFGFEAIFSTIVFVSSAITSVVVYIFSILSWLTGGFASIVTAAPAWAQPFITLPVFLLGLQLLKLIIITVNVLWIG